MTPLTFDPIIKSGDYRLGDAVSVPSDRVPGATVHGFIRCLLGDGLAIIRDDARAFRVIPLDKVTVATRYRRG